MPSDERDGGRSRSLALWYIVLALKEEMTFLTYMKASNVLSVQNSANLLKMNEQIKSKDATLILCLRVHFRCTN
jgi:hypothetical protein